MEMVLRSTQMSEQSKEGSAVNIVMEREHAWGARWECLCGSTALALVAPVCSIFQRQLPQWTRRERN